jgi:hypothetical protein
MLFRISVYLSNLRSALTHNDQINKKLGNAFDIQIDAVSLFNVTITGSSYIDILIKSLRFVVADATIGNGREQSHI